MPVRQFFRIALFAVVVLAAEAAILRADVVPGPRDWHWRDANQNERPRLNGPFRACGSGMGLGLLGIGSAWALLWLGHRLGGRTRRDSQ